MRRLLMIGALAVVVGCNAVSTPEMRRTKDSLDKSAKYHKLATEAKLLQAEITDLLGEWKKTCAGNLTMDGYGDVVCVPIPFTPPAPPAGPPSHPVPGPTPTVPTPPPGAKK